MDAKERHRLANQKYTEAALYAYKSFRENIPFLMHLKSCIIGKVSEEVKQATIEQLDRMVQEEKERIQSQPANGLIQPNLVR